MPFLESLTKELNLATQGTMSARHMVPPTKVEPGMSMTPKESGSHTPTTAESIISRLPGHGETEVGQSLQQIDFPISVAFFAGQGGQGLLKGFEGLASHKARLFGAGRVLEDEDRNAGDAVPGGQLAAVVG